ncbi:MAG: 2-amino-4-hydroxy-6-hydroxymethyldihydropteridine diphosphokinase, partial [Lachnospiraceae bacterium]|nr:2-amino-4-hydroxy-6-hydroxymethyldihydropteridine diphosphokinase [Lachnospiraceae bacterium]
ICEKLLCQYKRLEKITLTIEKPWAPVLLPLKTVSVTITRQWHKVYLGIGSNMGDRKKYLEDAVQFLKEESDIRDVKVSKWIETEPYGYEEQECFLNGCIYLLTLKQPYELLDFLHEIENRAGRKRTIHWGPRTLDLDILFYDKLIMEEEDLIIPHKEIEKRAFVLEPLRELAPAFHHPITGLSIEKMCELLDKEGK